jgi:hypothetical protein
VIAIAPITIVILGNPLHCIADQLCTKTTSLLPNDCELVNTTLVLHAARCCREGSSGDRGHFQTAFDP